MIARAGHWLLNAASITITNLVRLGRILPPAGSVVRDRILSMFRSKRLEQSAETVSAMELPVITNLLMGSDMVAPMSVELIPPYLDRGLLAILPFELNLHMN